MNLASNTAPVAAIRPSNVAAIHLSAGCRVLLLHVRENLTGIGLIPAPVQVLGRKPELNDEIARQVLRLDLATLFLP